MKKILSVIFVLVIMSSYFVLHANAESGTCGDNLTWALDNNGILTISGTGEMKEFDNYYLPPWYSFRESIKSVIMENGVTTISYGAFRDCTALTSINIPDSVTTIKTHAFDSCTALTSVSLGSSVTSIGHAAFNSCDALESINIPDSVTTIGSHAFDYCTALTSVSLGSGVTSIGDNAFSRSSKIKEVLYGGTAEQWNNITINPGNEYLKNAARTYTVINVRYNPNGGAGELETIPVEKNAPFTVSSNIPTREGYTFLGWATAADAKIAECKPGDIFMAGTEDITLYAIWKKTVYTKTQAINGIFLVTPTGVEDGNSIIFACYNGDKMVFVNPYVYAGETTIPFMTTENYDKVKIMV